MNKKVFLIGMLLGTLPLGVAAQEVLKPDTIHTELRSDFLEELGDTTDLVVAGSGTGNWFISLSGGVNSLAAEGNRDYDKFISPYDLISVNGSLPYGDSAYRWGLVNCPGIILLEEYTIFTTRYMTIASYPKE